MDTTVPARDRTGNTEASPWKGGAASGLVILASVVLITAGIVQFLEGLAAVINDKFLIRVQNYVYEFDTTTWGWIHLVIGALCVLVGVFILSGSAWARWIGIVLAGLSAVSNFLFIPYSPLWSLLLAALDIAVIWALALYDPR